METHYSHWLEEVNASITRLKAICEKVYIVGDSLGGGLGMVASLSNSVAGIVTMSTPIFTAGTEFGIWYLKPPAVLWNIMLKR